MITMSTDLNFGSQIDVHQKNLKDEQTIQLSYCVIKEILLLLNEANLLLKDLTGRKPSREFYDLPEAAEYLGIGKSTLRKALADGDIICDRVGRKLRFSKAQLDKYIRRGKSDAEIDAEVENTILSNKLKRK